MTYDYKQLCAELHAALEKHDLSLAEDQLLDRSAAALRAALAEPEPPSLKMQALDSCDRLRNETWCEEIDHDLDLIRRALESLPD